MNPGHSDRENRRASTWVFGEDPGTVFHRSEVWIRTSESNSKDVTYIYS